MKYTYELTSTNNPSVGNLGWDGIDSIGQSQEAKLAMPGKIDLGQNARYEISFQMTHTGYSSGGYAASGIICFVNEGNNVSLMFGNSGDAMGRLGCLLNEDVTNSPGQQNLVNTALGSNVWTAQYGDKMGYNNGYYEYTIIFETFADETVDDMIHFGVKNIQTGQSSYFSMSSIHLPCGGNRSQVFDDIDFILVGESNADNNTNGKVSLITKSEGVTRATLKTYTRTAETIPEPSAFGLIASMGALALVASRRRRK